jgi:hypothetical protein
MIDIMPAGVGVGVTEIVGVGEADIVGLGDGKAVLETIRRGEMTQPTMIATNNGRQNMTPDFIPVRAPEEAAQGDALLLKAVGP